MLQTPLRFLTFSILLVLLARSNGAWLLEADTVVPEDPASNVVEKDELAQQATTEMEAEQMLLAMIEACIRMLTRAVFLSYTVLVSYPICLSLQTADLLMSAQLLCMQNFQPFVIG